MSVIISKEVRAREKEIRMYIEQHSESFDLDPNLIRAIITQESRFIADAVSPTGAFGLGQMTGIGARQVKLIAAMSDCPDPLELDEFTKRDADDPNLGVKAVCATIWWLSEKKYRRVENKKIKLEAILTFYNSGGKAAHLVIKYGGHASAVDAIKALPGRYRSQAVRYAPEVVQWYVAWHELLKEEAAVVETNAVMQPAIPFEYQLDPTHQALIATLQLLGQRDMDIEVTLNVQENLTEVTLIFPGEFPTDGSR